MAVLVLRTVKGSPLTHIELDNNFLNLDAEIHQNMGDISLMKGDIANLIALSLTAAATPPALPIQGTQWFDTVTSTLFVFDGAKWVNVGDAGIASGTAPVGPNTAGDTWFDTTSNLYKVFDGSVWKVLGSITPIGGAFVGTPIAGSMWFDTTTQTLQVFDGTAWVDASSATYSNTTAPANPKQGTLWFDTATETLKVYNGAVWTDSGETMPTGNVAPTNASQGDLWYDTASGLVMVYTGAIWKASGGVAFSGIAPTSPANGAQWFDTSTNTLYTWNGSSWVDAGSTTQFGTTAARPATGTTGDLYFNTTAGLLQLWDGGAWVTAGASKIDDLSDVDTTVAPTSGQVLAWDGTSQWKPATPGVFSGGASPASPVPGTQWFNTTTKSLMIYDGTNWLDTGSTTNSGTTAARPTGANSTAGDTYFNTTTGLLEVFDGLVWETAGAQKIDDLSDVDTTTNAPVSGQALVWNGTTWVPKNTTVTNGVQATRPTSPVAGELFFNASTNTLEVWTGGAWLDAGSTTASGATGTQPTPASVGDQFFNTTTGLLQVYNGGTWVTAGVQAINDLTDVDTTVAPTSGQVLAWDGTSQWKPATPGVFSGAAAPASFAAGTQWFNTTTKSLMVYDAVTTTWLDVGATTTSGLAAARPAAGVSTAGDTYFNETTGLLEVFDGTNWGSVGGSTPTGPAGGQPTPASTGDLYYNTTTGLLQVFDGGVWETAGAQSLNDLTDVDLTIPAATGKTLVFNGTNFVAGDSIDVRNLGPLAIAPTVRIDGSVLVDGDTYYDTAANKWYTRDTGVWVVSDVHLASATFQSSGNGVAQAGVGGILSMLLNDVGPTTITANMDGRYVRSVSGVVPDPVTGNAPVSLTSVEVGTDAQFQAFPAPANGTVFVTAGDPDPTKNGKTYIYSANLPNVGWYPVVGYDQAALDARYVNTDIDGLESLAGVSNTLAGVNKNFLVHNGTEWVAGTPSIDTLGDVDTSTTPPTSGQALVWNGTNWAAATLAVGQLYAAKNADPLTRDDGTARQDGDLYYNTTTNKLMTFNGGTSTWEISGASKIDDLTDVDTTTVAPTNNQTLVWTGANWTPGNALVFSGASAPTVPTPVAGTQWFNTTTKSLMVYDGTDWHDTGSTTNTGFVATRPLPAASSAGDQFFNQTTGLLEVFDGTAWETAGAQAINDLSDVDTTVAPTAGQVLAWDGTSQWKPANSTIFSGTIAPTSPITGSTWFNTTTGSLMVYDAATTTWLDTGSTTNSGVAGSRPASANSTAGDTYFNTTTGLLEIFDGLVWETAGAQTLNDLTDVDTTGQTTGMTLVYNGTNWVPSNSSTFTGTTAPTPLFPGATWFDTNTNSYKVYTGTAWLDTGSTTASGASGAQPSPATVGDQFYNTTTGLLQVYNGGGWVTAGAQKIDDLTDVDTTTVAPTNNQTLVWTGTNWTPGNATVFSGIAAPTVPTPVDGTQWFNTTTKSLMVYDAATTTWLDTGSTTNTGLVGVRPLPAVSSAGDQFFNQTTGLLEVFDGTNWVSVGVSGGSTGATVAAAAPLLPANGALWYDTTEDVLKVNTGTSAVPVWEPAATISTVSPTASPPTLPATGDLWYDTTAAALKINTGTSAVPVWVSTGGGTSVAVTYSNAVPTGTAVVGSEHYVTSDGTRAGTISARYIYDTTGWLLIPSAGGSLTISDTAPVGPANGDLWYDSLTTYRTYVWSTVAAAWVDVAPASSVSKIDDLTDVDTSSIVPTAGVSILMWNAAGNNWVPGNILDASPTGGVSNDF